MSARMTSTKLLIISLEEMRVTWQEHENGRRVTRWWTRVHIMINGTKADNVKKIRPFHYIPKCATRLLAMPACQIAAEKPENSKKMKFKTETIS